MRFFQGLVRLCAIFTIVLALSSLTSALEASTPKVTWREILAAPLSRGGLFLSPEEFGAVIPPRSVATEGIRPFTEVMRSLYETFDSLPETHYFFCTVYYTPRESGFTVGRGFNTTPDARQSLRSRRLYNDFARATYVEGFGRLAEPVNGLPYLFYDGSLHSRILGNRGNTLIDRLSIAVHRGNPLFGKGTQTWILDREIYNQFGGTRYEVGDTGGGLFRSQIDLYWGEDDPLGPGSEIFRPASCDVAMSWIVPVLVWR